MADKKLSFDLLFRRWLRKEKICFKHYVASMRDTDGEIRVGAHTLGWIKDLDFQSYFDATGKLHPFYFRGERYTTTFNAADPDFFDKVKRHLRVSVKGLTEHLKDVQHAWNQDVVKPYHTEG